MRLIELDATRWTRPKQFYRALLSALGAPVWHGHNLDALNDSIFGGHINQVEPPFRIIIKGGDELDPAMRELLKEASSMFSDGRTETGLDAYLEIQPSL
jgi:RNAse (barnase) inhibitor barstar